MRAFIKRSLDPSERMSELLFGLIMTLTFTLGASMVVQEGPEATKELLVGVIGCNIAWGLIDGLLYILTSMFSRGATNRASHLLRESGREAADEALAARIEETFGDAIAKSTSDALRGEILEHLAKVQPERVRLKREDLYGALASFVLVALTAAPAVVPFLFIENRFVAIRVSNLVMIALIFLIGRQWAKAIDASRNWVGFAMAFGGLVIVQITILLGG